ncbi:hypothetical protein DFA_06090 [Cavenderia fasciculata]|uniref:Uncharacterized protein n=1 Tax=Cavenderia fasciculata TaxID=261658 RepID=F4PK28_CACFS|nr:uncharacterized protein DFA_06090 [Cavenderia fasciculata]EGG23952.1 hypothetical protein DFA_06090 [Cavenderia fasciculata]|eukprot:XP_004361803.1 hypothetical protein DFA_06090 [Cavenderia fasciculata]
MESTGTRTFFDKSHDDTLFKSKIQPNTLNWEQFLQSTQWKGESFDEFKEKNNY